MVYKSVRGFLSADVDIYGTIPLNILLLRRQLALYGKIAHLPDSKLIFEEGTCDIRSVLNRKRGRPRQEWGMEVAKMVEKMIPDSASRQREIADEDTWKIRIWNFIELFKPDND